MKRASMTLNFENDTLIAFGHKIPLLTTHSGHYAVPITQASQLMNNAITGTVSTITLKLSEESNTAAIAQKLHRQFAHPTKEKLLKMLNLAGEEWNTNQTLKDEIKNVTENCETCKRYKKPPSRPVVGLPTATEFLETVAMDLKFYHGKIILHLIDHCTRLSASTLIPNKNPETIVKAIFKIWISVYGTTKSFLTDNGGEFANTQFIEMCESLNINVKTTAAESPWSNGIVERHNLVISEMLDKVLHDFNCTFEIALAWCINAKNSLTNIHGFSPYQLAIGSNPNLPSCHTDKLPALTNQPSNKIISDNLCALHKAREAFIASENSEKIRRALSHNTRTFGDIKYFTGDSVYYKRASSRSWHGPCKVLGQDGQQVLLKHGSNYIRVHPCRLQLASDQKHQQNEINDNTPTIRHSHEDQSNSNYPLLP